MKQNHTMNLLKLFIILIFFMPLLVNAQAIKDSIRKNYTLQDYENFLQKELRGEIPDGKGIVPSMRSANDVLVNNNTGATGTASFTQSETSILAYGSNVLVGFNDAGSYSGGANKFTGYSYSTDGGATFTDGGTLPTNPGGDAGDPVFARDETTGRIYFTTLGFTDGIIKVFLSDDDGVTWSAPVSGTPGGSTEDKQWVAVDNFAGAGNGNVYLISRSFGAPNGIYLYRSTDNGATFGPNGGVQIVSTMQGAYVVVGPDHTVYAFWWNGASIKMRKSTDQGVTFDAAVDVATGLTGPQTNGGLSLTGLRQGTATYSGFRSNSFPHVAVNPVSGHLYVTFNDNPAGVDKGDIFMVMSTDGGATWSARTQINDDATTTDQWQPTIAVTTTGNELGVFYYSREDDATNNNLITFNGRTATISGSTVTFTPSFVISDIQSLPEFGRDGVVNATYMGDYNSASATATDFHVVWSDNRDNLSGGGNRKDPNVYYKSIPAGLLAGANISVAPVAYDFGFVEINQSAGPIQITITNVGDADLTVSDISNPDPDFSISAPSLPAVIPSLGSVTIEVSFAPSSEGLQTSSFDITSDALNNPTVTVDLAGTGMETPANDACDDAIAIDCGTSIDGYTILATIDNVVTCGGVSNTGPGVWYSIVGNGYPLTLSTCTAASFDTKISVFSGACDALVCEGGNDNSCGSSAALTFATTVGTTYYVLVHGAGTSTGTFTLTALCSSEIDVAPTQLTFNVPLNGTASDLLTISNASGSHDLNWTMIGSEEALSPFMHGFSTNNQFAENGTFMYKVTNRTIFSLMSDNLPADLLHNLDQLKNESVMDKKSFTSSVTNLIGEENSRQYMATILDKSKQIEEESKKLPQDIYLEDESTSEVMSITGSGGPDGGNYVWIDSDEPGGPIFNWTDITGTGTSVALGDDASVLVTLPFNFEYYGETKTEVRISSNGYLTFGTYGSYFSNASIPNAANPNDIICPFWDDLSPNVGGTVHYLSTSSQFIVQYTNIPRWNDGSSLMTFQVILNDDGSILYQYYSMVGLLHYATIGIENATGDDGLQVAYNNGVYIHDNLAVLFSLPAPCPWITSVAPTSGTVSGGGSQQVTVDVDATGLRLGTYECHLTIYSNAANSGKIDIPVTLNVVEPCEAPTVTTKNTTVELDADGNASIVALDILEPTTFSDLTSTANWLGYVGVFEDGVFVAGDVTAIGDVKSTIDAGADEITLQPNFNPFYPDNFENSVLQGSTYIEDFGTLAGGASFSFTGSVASSTLDPMYEGFAFIRIFDVAFNLLEEIDDPLIEGNDFTVQYNNTQPGAYIFQYGFTVEGPSGADGDEASLGNAVVQGMTLNIAPYSSCGLVSVEISQSEFDCSNLGPNDVTVTATDINGEVSTGTATVTVEDNEAPVLTVTSTPITLWPPNHKYETIDMSQLFVSVEDNCGDLSMVDVYITSVSSDEAEDAPGNGDGKTVNDIVINSDCNSVDLRKERSGNGNGRVYTIYLAVDDGNGNTGTASCQVHVPHNNGGTAVDDGMAYEVACGEKSSLISVVGSDVELKNYPNPFKGTTTIQFTLENTSNTKLTVYNSLGVEVARLFNGTAEGKQVYQLEFNSIDLPSGIYFYHLQTSDGVNTVKKMQLIK
ncbi:MAG TPA: choice-of-anchor D domain-containing protein [Bacteroidales bacterium]